MKALILLFPVRLWVFFLFFSIMLYLCHLVVKVRPAHIKIYEVFVIKQQTLIFFFFRYQQL